MKVLVIQQKMIGDVLLSTVICEAIKTAYPQCEVHYMIHPNTLAVVDNNPFIDRIVVFDPQLSGGFLGLVKLGQSLKVEKYDVVIDAYAKLESLIPTLLSAAAKRIGFKKWYSWIFYTKSIQREEGNLNNALVHRLLLATEVTGNTIKPIFPQIYLSEREKEVAAEKIQESIGNDKKLLMISVLGSNKKKSLPASQMAETLDFVAAQTNATLLFNFLPNQLEEATKIYNLCKPETQAVIELDFYTKSLREFLAILSQCQALIGNEGGAVNMAKALSIPTFTIFSPWINKDSWNMLTEQHNHEAVHISDYYPELYSDINPKKYKGQSTFLYQKLELQRYSEKLKNFLEQL